MAVCDALSQGGAGAGNNGSGSGNTSNGNGKSAPRNGGIVDSMATTPGSGNLFSAVSVHIVGSDLLPHNIETADRGVYRQSALDGLPPATIKNYFSKITSPSILLDDTKNETEERGPKLIKNDASNGSQRGPANGAHLLVKPRLRSLVTFNCMNLARPGYIGRFDCIFCMDVLPHFSRAQRIALIERMHLYLEPGGYLFLSQTEKLITSNLNFRSESFDGYTFHRKPLAASAAYGR
jgi:chemotaxis methyl-accepting protein methylase